MVTGDMIINFSPVFTRLEVGVYLGPELLKNNIMKCFRWPILYYPKNVWNETVCSQHCSFKSAFLVIIWKM